jgi:hypothetical protein
MIATKAKGKNVQKKLSKSCQKVVKKLTSSFLLYMPVFAALVGGKVALYHPFQFPASGKVLYRPLEELQWVVK